jgi:16S rRNA (cytidine1402-2'-O)-methyltransferase
LAAFKEEVFFYNRKMRVIKVSGKLFIIGTPIGNLSDMSSRTVSALSTCDLIFVEDTRVTVKLLNHFNIKVRMVSCHKHNEHERLGLLGQVAQSGGTVGLVSDAGMPLVSDPGSPIVEEAIRLDMEIVPIPGPTAFVLALVGSGLPADKFVFEGFLADKASEMTNRLSELASEKRTMIFYVSPHKVARTLSAMYEIFGERRACLCRELTKMHEEFRRDALSRLAASTDEVRGEVVLVVEGCGQAERDFSDWLNNEGKRQAVLIYVEKLLKSGIKLTKACGLAAQEFAISRSDIYRECMNDGPDREGGD